MLKAARVLIIIAMVFTWYTIISLVIGIIALKKMDEANNKDDLLAMSILTLLFCSTISGILMLIASDKDLEEYQKGRKTRKENE